jgi:hypothetical protein
MIIKTMGLMIWLTGVLCFIQGAAVGPKVSIDTLTVDFGTVFEQKSRFLTHTFSIKNIGDSPLEIYNIRPGCGCTTFKTDSVIQPGKTGRLAMRLDLSELRNGRFFTYLRVSTADPHYPRAQFGFNGILKPIIYIDSGAIVLPTLGKKDTSLAVTLFTEKPDLMVTGVSFVYDNPPSEWLSNMPIRFNFRKTGKKSKEGIWSYILQVLYPQGIKETAYGKFAIKTNHADKPEIKITGVLDPVH